MNNGTNNLQFTTEKGNLIKVIGVTSTGFGLNEVEYTILVNEILQEQKFNYSQIKNLANGKF